RSSVRGRTAGVAMAKAGTSRHRFSLGSLGVLPFELRPLFMRRRCIRTGEQGRPAMVEDDPPNVERKKASVCTWVRGIARKLVNPRTLMLALQILYWITKLARWLTRLFGDS